MNSLTCITLIGRDSIYSMNPFPFICKGIKVYGTDNQEKDEKQSQNDKTELRMEKTVKDKAKSKPESQSSQKVNRKVNWVDITEAENASLRARIKTTEAIKKITRNRERQFCNKMERQLATVQESQRQDIEDFRKLKELVPSQFG
ncbi:hypothetical protein Tco_0835879 [Tanacetum coccineum]